MKSNRVELVGRGFFELGAESNFINLTCAEKVALLKSGIAQDRTLGARLLACNGVAAVNDLVQALVVEKKLYPKIEICNTLVTLGEVAVKPLIAKLGRIGGNQHRDLPSKSFEKKSYPLPRDIAARTLAHIGVVALPDLLDVLDEDDLLKLSEAIDAIGFICFYSHQPEIYSKLIACYKHNSGSDLIRWKLVRAMSGFPESIEFLIEQRTICDNSMIKQEIDRSIRLINKRIDSIDVRSISQ